MNMLQRFRRFIPEKGLTLTIVLGFAVSLFYFGNLYTRPGQIFFSASGDGFQIYYQSMYHNRYDTQWWHQTSINYPYGESIFFTGAMPFISNLTKPFDSSGSLIVWFINVMLLLSPVIGAVFLYLIFRHLKLPLVYSSLCAVGIAFLSPQLIRMTGHFSLQWIFLIPAFVYSLLKFHEHPRLKLSLLISFLVFLGASTHIYFLAFYFALGGAYWAWLFITKDRGFGRWRFVLKHASIQLLAPLIIIQMIMFLTDPVSDRTSFPWGFFIYHSTLRGIFYPFNMPYEALVHNIVPSDDLEWEGLGYVGIAAIIGIITITVMVFVRLFQKQFRRSIMVTDVRVINIFFWVSVLLAWFGCAHPMIDDHRDWLLHLGPVKQFRAVGRFIWVFYYMVNIVVVYRLYMLVAEKKVFRFFISSAVVFCLYYDGYYYIHSFNGTLYNRIARLDDKRNDSPENQWLKKIDAKKFQAILPLPLFNVGSENLIRLPADNRIMLLTSIVSLQTGLPVMAVQGARTSLSESRKNIMLAYDPLHPYEIMNDIRDNRPLLVLVTHDSLDVNEKRILAAAVLLEKSIDMDIYSLDPGALHDVHSRALKEVKSRYDSAVYSAGPWRTNDSAAFIITHSFNNGAGQPFKGKASTSSLCRLPIVLYDSVIPKGRFIISYWVGDIITDIRPRAPMEIAVRDSLGNITFYDQATIQWRMKAIDGTWGLVEESFPVVTQNSKLSILLWNPYLKKDVMITADEFLLRPENCDVFRMADGNLMMNNRYYPVVK